MSKNKDRKKDKKLRQEIEILKAQLGTTGQLETKSVAVASTSDTKTSFQKIEMIDDKYIKQDLMKTIILSAGAFAIIITLWALDITSFRF